MHANKKVEIFFINFLKIFTKIFLYLGHLAVINTIFMVTKGVIHGISRKSNFVEGFFSTYAPDILKGGEILPDGRMSFEIPGYNMRYINFCVILLIPLIFYFCSYICRLLQLRTTNLEKSKTSVSESENSL